MPGVTMHVMDGIDAVLGHLLSPIPFGTVSMAHSPSRRGDLFEIRVIGKACRGVNQGSENMGSAAPLNHRHDDRIVRAVG
jgi:hypothetical protein